MNEGGVFVDKDIRGRHPTIAIGLSIVGLVALVALFFIMLAPNAGAEAPAGSEITLQDQDLSNQTAVLDNSSNATVIENTSNATVIENSSDDDILKNNSDDTATIGNSSNTTILENISDDAAVVENASDDTIIDNSSNATALENLSNDTAVENITDIGVVENSSDDVAAIENASDLTVLENTSDGAVEATSNDTAVMENTSDAILESLAVNSTQAPAGSQVTIQDQNFSNQTGIPENIFIGNPFGYVTTATLDYNSAAGAIEYKLSGNQIGSMYLGIDPIVNGNISIDLKMSSDDWNSGTVIKGSTFWIQTQTLYDGSVRVYAVYYTSPTTLSYQYYDVPASQLVNGVNTINIRIDGTTKTVTVYYDDAHSITTPMSPWSVQNLPYDAVTWPVIEFSNEKGASATYVSTLLYGVRETVSGGVVTAVPGDDYVPFGIDYPRIATNQLGTDYMISNGQKGVAWVDLDWLEWQPEQIAYTQTLLDAGWELGIHFTVRLNDLPLADAQALMRSEYDQVTAIFGQAPTSWSSLQNADNVNHAIYAYDQLGMVWRSVGSFIPNVGNLEDSEWTDFWSKASSRQMVYPAMTHNTDGTVSQPWTISLDNFRTWVDNYDGKHIVGYYEYQQRMENQVETTITVVDYAPDQHLKFSVQTNGFPSRLVIEFPASESTTVTKNGAQMVRGVDYTVVDSNHIVVFASSNDLFELSVGGSATVPSAPRNLAASPGNAQVTLTWVAPSSDGGSAITGYNIYRSTSPGSETLLTTVGNVLTYIDTGVTNGATYYYKVSAVNSMGEGAMSSETSATPVAPATAPSAPQNPMATAGNAQVALTWNAPSNNGGSPVTGYKVYRGTAPGGETLLATIGNVLTYVDSSVSNGVTYYYKISAVNAVGEGAMSSEASATPATVPSAPQSLAATPGNGQIALTWMAPSSNGGSAITGYKIYRGTVSGGETLLTTVGNVLTYTNSGLTNGVTYYYKVSAINSVGEGSLSSEVSATPVAPVTVPSAPQGLGAAGGNAQVTLTWSAPAINGGSPVTGYTIYRGTSSGSETLLAMIGNVLTYTDGGLTNGVTYYYKVSASNTAGEGPLSSEVSVTPVAPATMPSAPQNLAATPGNAQVTLAWTAPSSDGGSAITNYKIYRSTTAGGEMLLATVGNVLSYTDSGLTNGQTYYYQVSAVNSVGEGPLSNEASTTPVAPTTVPSAPQGLSAVGGDGQAALAWSAPVSNGGAAITNYKIYRDGSLLTTVGNVLTYTDTGLTNGQTYTYTVSAVNSKGEGPMSNQASATPAAVATAPSAPQSLAAVAGNAQVALFWNAPSNNGGSDITGYKVYRGTTSGGETLLATVGNVLTYTDGTAVNGVTYYYQLSAVNSVGEGPRSNEASAMPEAPATAPSAPQGLTATPGNAQVALNWAAPSSNGGSAITGYNIYRGTTAGGETLLTTVGSVLTYTDSGLTNGAAYYYKVSAVNAAGEGPLSNEATATPVAPATVPSAPQNLAATGDNAKVTLTWSAPANNGGSDVTGYKIYRGTASGGEVLLTTLGDVLTYTDSSVSNGVTYYYKVSAVNSVGEGPMSSEASATPSAPITVPSAPLNLVATAGNAQVTLTWTAPSSNGGSAITNYNIYRGTVSGGETLLTTVGNVLSFTNTGLTNGQTYYYKVSAVNAVGESVQSNEASAQPVAPTSSVTVTSPNSASTLVAGGRFTVTWTSEGPVSGLRVEVLRAGAVVATLTSYTANDGAQSFVLPIGLAPGSDYQIRISQYNNAAISDVSDTFTVRAPSMSVINPSEGQTFAPGSRINIQWTGDLSALGRVNIGLYQNGERVGTISSGTSNDGSLSWRVPYYMPPGAYQIKITSNPYPAYYAWSGTFNVG